VSHQNELREILESV
jgi:hypothetical protein